MSVPQRKNVGQDLREFKVQEYRFRLETKADDPEDPLSWIMEGYASTWDPDQVQDRIEMGAFAKTILKKLVQAIDLYGYSDIPLFRDHCSNIGITLEAKEDAKGLWVRCKISKTSLGSDTRQLMIDRAISRMSIGYYVLRAREEMDEKNQILIRVIEEIELLEVSAVTFPANDKARILQVKSRYLTEEVLAQVPDHKADEPAKEEIKEEQIMDTPAWLTGLKEWVDQHKEAKSLEPAQQRFVLKGMVMLNRLATKGVDEDEKPEEEKTEDLPALRRENPGTYVSGQDPDGKGATAEGAKTSEKPSQEGETKASANISEILDSLRSFQVS